MATTLQSPGVQVTVVDESFYTPAAPGTVPLIFVASAQDKTNPSGTVAVGTQAANAGTVYLITSQRDLTDTFGTPLFYTDAGGNPINGGELNEYGLQAAYSLLGVSSQAYVVRAPVDLAALAASSSAPAGNPADGSYWLDTANTVWGIFEWNQSTGSFTNKTPIVIDDSNYTTSTLNGNPANGPAANIGTKGQYAVVATSALDTNVVWYKNSDGNWVEVGSSANESWSNSNTSTFVSTVYDTSWPTVVGTTTPTTITTGSTFVINNSTATITVTNGETLAAVASSINNVMRSQGVGAKILNGSLALYATSIAASNGTTKDGNISIVSTTTATSLLLSELGLTPGTYSGPTVFVGPHTQYPDFTSEPSGSVYMKTTSPNSGQIWTVKQWSASSELFTTVSAPVYGGGAAAIYGIDPTGGGANIPVGTVYVESNFDHGNNTYNANGNKLPVLAEFKIHQRAAVSPTTITSAVTTGTISLTSGTITLDASVPGVNGHMNTTTISVSSGTTLTPLVTAINNSGVPYVSATLNANGTVSISHSTGGEIRFTDSNNILGSALFNVNTTANYYEMGAYEPTGRTTKASNWTTLSYTASPVAPSTQPANGQLWYSSIVDQVDIMYNNGTEWVGYLNAFPTTDPNGPQVAALAPTTQSDGTPLVTGDIWISTADLETYGQLIYVWNHNTLQWVLQDTADHTSPNGWVFADARWATTGQSVTSSAITALLVSNYVDPDAPDPALYPRGTRLWNLRRSGFNVKQYVTNYINLNANGGYNIRVPGDQMNSSGNPYNANRWVSVSPNAEDGTGTFGRKAQRALVVSSMKALIDGNTAVRDTDALNFNLIAAPGYVETVQNLIGLNTDRGLTAFVIGDTPFRLPSDATSLQAWGANTNGAYDNGDVGAVSYDQYTALYYPSGFTNDLTGNNIVVPPSHMMLRTFALSDQQSYPWFAPAGVRRGVVDNATSVGYVDGQTGEFVLASLPQPTRDVLASVKVNPIATIGGVGLVAFGQYTRANVASSLDRINVARLVAYLRRQLDILSKPYLFEPNDKITRDEIKNAAQSMLLELVGQRAIYDFIVVCDESNNTPDRIDRSELWMDIAIEPVKAVEFIYIPLRLVNTGSIEAGTYTLA